MPREISEDRKFYHSVGLGLIVLGLLLFFGTMFSGVLGQERRHEAFNKWVQTKNPFDRPPSLNTGPSPVPALIGFFLVFAGILTRGIAAQGLAGSGLVLDPKRAREDLEPHSRMVGGMLSDALDEAKLHLGAEPEQLVMIRCRTCSHLNPEESKFCNECGSEL